MRRTINRDRKSPTSPTSPTRAIGDLEFKRRYRGGNYLPKMVEAIRHTPLPRIGEMYYRVMVLHEDRCALPDGFGPCTCDNPEIILELRRFKQALGAA
jgi:hypothetical protein